MADQGRRLENRVVDFPGRRRQAWGALVGWGAHDGYVLMLTTRFIDFLRRRPPPAHRPLLLYPSQVPGLWWSLVLFSFSSRSVFATLKHLIVCHHMN